MGTARRVAFVAAIVLALAAAPAWAQRPNGCQSLAGSLAASIDWVRGGWVGKAFLSMGSGGPVAFDLEDSSAGYKDRNNPKMLWGSEHYLLTSAGGTLIFDVDFLGSPSSAPFMGQYGAEGRINGGTGSYASASGNVSVHGPWLFAPPVSSWMSEIKGTICGVQ
jgi:hypothetical protein